MLLPNEKKIHKHYFYERLYYRLERHNLHEMPRGNETPEIKFSLAVSPDSPGVEIYSFWPLGQGSFVLIYLQAHIHKYILAFPTARHNGSIIIKNGVEAKGFRA